MGIDLDERCPFRVQCSRNFIRKTARQCCLPVAWGPRKNDETVQRSNLERELLADGKREKGLGR
jgi:hypothetical protein